MVQGNYDSQYLWRLYLSNLILGVQQWEEMGNHLCVVQGKGAEQLFLTHQLVCRLNHNRVQVLHSLLANLQRLHF